MLASLPFAAQVASIVVLAILLFGGCGLLLFPLLPKRLRIYQPVLSPYFGYALISAIAHPLGVAGFSLHQTRWLYPLLAASGWATLLLRRQRRIARAARVPVACTALALVAALVPLCAVGYLTTVGATSDAVSYISRADYLQHSPPIAPEPSQGQWHLQTVTAHLLLLRLGDVYALGVVSGLAGLPAFETFTVLGALFFALMAGSAAMWVRVGLRVKHAGLAGVLIGTNNLLLWPLYDNFLSQVVALSLVPPILTVLASGLRRLDWRSAAALGILVGAVVSTYPVFAIYVLAGAGAMVVALRLSGSTVQTWPRLLGGGFGVAAAILASNPVASWRAVTELRLISTLLDRGVATVGRGNILVFPPPLEWLGLLSHPLAAYDGDWSKSVPLALYAVVAVAALAFVTYGWWRLLPAQRIATAALLVVLALLLAHQRYGVNRPDGYPYGYFKVSTLLALPLTVLLGVGIGLAARRARALAGTAVVGICAAGVLVAIVASTLATYRWVLARGVTLDREVLSAVAAVTRLPADSWVLIDVQPGMHQHWLGNLVRRQKILFYQHPYSGELQAFGAIRPQHALVEREVGRRRPGGFADPWQHPSTYQTLWSSRRFELRRERDPALATLHWPDPRWQPGTNLVLRLDRGRGTAVGTLDTLSTESALRDGEAQIIELSLTAPEPFSLEIAPLRRTLEMGAGAWKLTVADTCWGPGASLEVRATSGSPLLTAARYLAGEKPEAPGHCVEQRQLPIGATHVAQEVRGSRIRYEAVVVPELAAAKRPHRLGLHVGDGHRYFGVWSIDVPAGPHRAVLEVDLADRSTHGELDGATTDVLASSLETATGSFEVDVVFWRLAPSEQLAVQPLLWFRRDADELEVLRTGTTPTLRILGGG